jgi:hypothetical protein|tara:strand:+ start:2359 stop:2829 length:471 start_codon:yes stop_codon:yes gene_type:complete
MGNREREAYRTIKENAYKSYTDGEAQVYEVEPIKTTKPNYFSAVLWTSAVATIVCAVFMGFLLYMFNELNLEDNLQKAANHAIANLERVVLQQNKEIQTLKEENKKIHHHLQFWQPITCKPKEKWIIPGYGLPEEIPVERQDRNIKRYGNSQCFSY